MTGKLQVICWQEKRLPQKGPSTKKHVAFNAQKGKISSTSIEIFKATSFHRTMPLLATFGHTYSAERLNRKNEITD